MHGRANEYQVADFGFAKLASDGITHVSIRVMGTFGYLAPEYASSGKLIDKSDVFSFGVMLPELITGRRPVDTTPFAKDSTIVRALEGDVSLDDLNEEVKPGYSTVYGSYGSIDYDFSQYLFKAFH
ncbi:hypothetical protein SUGI_0495260 [Cryptomeria japonica]|nr:hypothetical protein SUGI_0495260 [Cryptomeria japonica]